MGTIVERAPAWWPATLGGRELVQDRGALGRMIEVR
jgi:hypothetical protein